MAITLKKEYICNHCGTNVSKLYPFADTLEELVELKKLLPIAHKFVDGEWEVKHFCGTRCCLEWSHES